MSEDSDSQENDNNQLEEITVLLNLRLMGLKGLREFSKVAADMHNSIRTHYSMAGSGFKEYEIISIRKVVSDHLLERYNKRRSEVVAETGNANEKLLYHGSSAVSMIAKTGFDMSYASKGGMFGPGIYFAEHSSKSNQYVFGYMGGSGCLKHSNRACYECHRQMLVCRVTLGKEYKSTKAQILQNAPRGYHSITGVPSSGGLLYPEYVVFDPNQAYPEYLITYKTVK